MNTDFDLKKEKLRKNQGGYVMMRIRQKSFGVRVIYLNTIFLLLISFISGCPENKGPKQGSLIIATKKSDGQGIDCKIGAYTQDDHVKEFKQGISGIEMFLPVGKYDVKIDWRGNIKWIDGVNIEETGKFTDTVIFPAGKLKVNSKNNDGTVAESSILIVPDRDRQNGVEAVKDSAGTVTEIYIKGQKIALAETLSEVSKILKPEKLRAEIIIEKDGPQTYETRFYKVLGANIDITFVKEGSEDFRIQQIGYEDKVAAGIAGEEIELSPGIYDVKVEHQGVSKWIENIEITDKEINETEIVYEQGWVIVGASNYDYSKGSLPISVYVSGDRDLPVKNGKLGEKFPLVPGVYDIMVEYKGRYNWILGVNVKAKETIQKTIRLPEG